MYAGTVTAVNLKRADWSSWPDGWYTEEGTIEFRVERTLVGKPVDAITVRFWWGEEKDQPANVADWIGPIGVWPARPRKGEKLTLLLCGPKQLKGWVDESWPHWPVSQRWEIAADDPRVIAFEDIGKFLSTESAEEKKRHFKHLCQSKYRNIRQFASGYALDNTYIRWPYPEKPYDPKRHSKDVVEYLGNSKGVLADDEEIASVTWQLGQWLVCGGWGKQATHERPAATNEARTAFAEWYLKELACVEKPARCKRALEALLHAPNIAWEPREKLVLFPGAARAQLLERLHILAASGHPDLSALAQKLLKELSSP